MCLSKRVKLLSIWLIVVASDATRFSMDNSRRVRHAEASGWIDSYAIQASDLGGTSAGACLNLRGGDLGLVKGDFLAKLLCVLCFGDAIAASITPATSMEWMGIEIDPSNRFSYHFLHGIGASASTMSVSLYLAILGNLPLEKSLGYGYLARLISMSVLLLTFQYKDLGMNFRAFGGMWLVVALTSYSLLSAFEDALFLVKVVSVVLGVHGILLAMYPTSFVAKVCQQDKYPAQKGSVAVNVASLNGGYMWLSAVTTLMLASGVAPVRVAGYAALMFLPVLKKLIDSSTLKTFFGIDTTVCFAGVSLLMVLIAAGTLR